MGVLRILLYLLLLIFPFGVILRFDLPSSVALSATDLVLFAIFIVFVAQVSRLKKNMFKFRYFRQLLILIIALLVSLFLNAFRLQKAEFLVAFLYLARFVTYSFLLFVLQLFDREFLRKFTVLLGVAGVVFAAFGIIQYIYYPSLRNLYYLGWDEHLYRVFSTFLDPNFAGSLLVLVLVLLTGLFQANVFLSAFAKICIFSSWVILFISFLLTYSRSSYIMFLLTFLFYLTLTKQKFLLITLFLIFFIGIIFIPKDLKSEGVNLLRTASILERKKEIERALIIFQASPVFGVGFNAYRYSKQEYGFLPGDSFESTHSGAGVPNSFLFVLATGGIIGFLVFINFLWKIIRGLYGKVKNRNQKGNLYFSAAIFSSFVGVVAHSLFENTLFFPFIMIWIFAIVGISAGLED